MSSVLLFEENYIMYQPVLQETLP